MEKILAKRAMALFVIMALAMVAFVGLSAVNAEDPLPASLTVTIQDNYGDAMDGMTYAGDDIMFKLDGWVEADNYTAEIMINDGTAMEMTYNDTENYYHYTLTGVAAGEHTWKVMVTNSSESIEVMNETDMPIMVYEMPMFAGTATAMVDEDSTTWWDLSGAFTPAGMTIAIANETELEALGWMIESDPVMDAAWNITPPENMDGVYEFEVTATHSYGMVVSQMIDITVDAVNDAPMIENLMVADVEVPIEWYNYTWVEDDTNMSEWRWVANLSFEEDGMASFMVNAMDIETMMMDLTYELLMPEAPLTIENDLNETNVTIPYNFTITGDADANGMFWGTLNVTDGELYHMIWIMLEITPMNDAPTATEDWDMMYDIKTGEELNLSVSNIADIDGDEVSVMWYIDDVMETMEFDYFKFSWDMAGMYNVSAKISDGVDTVDVGYFMANVTIANTAPVITDASATPVDIDPFDIFDFYLLGEVEEGEDVELTVDVTDAESDELTYTWTNNQDSAWTADTATVVVPGDYLQKGLTYTFTVEVSDGTETVTMASNNITIVEADDTEGFFESLGIACMIIMIGIPLLIIIVIIIIVVKKKGKKEEELPEQPPMEEEMPMEGGEEMPMEGEVPMEQGMEEPMMEQPVAEEPVPAPEEPVPAPEEPVPAPEEPVAPEQPPAPEEPVPAPEEPVAPEQPPAPPEPPMPPQ